VNPPPPNGTSLRHVSFGPAHTAVGRLVDEGAGAAGAPEEHEALVALSKWMLLSQAKGIEPGVFEVVEGLLWKILRQLTPRQTSVDPNWHRPSCAHRVRARSVLQRDELQRATRLRQCTDPVPTPTFDQWRPASLVVSMTWGPFSIPP